MKKFLLISLGVLLSCRCDLRADENTTQMVDFPTTTKMNLKGGLSPSGKYQVWIVGRDPESEDYAFGIYGSDEKKPLFVAQVGGGFCFLQGASDIDSALWSDDDSMVAIQDHGTRHSMEIYILLIKDRKLTEIPLPKYGEVVSKAMANLHGGAETAWVLRPLKWDVSKFTFRLFGGPNRSDVTIKVIKTATPHAVLVSETPPVPIQEGDY